MIIPPEPMQLFAGQRAFIAYGAPWKDAVIALMDSSCGYDPWDYDDGMTPGDVLITVIATQPRVFGCIELIGWDSATDRFTVADKWNLVTLPEVPEWLSLPTRPGPLDHATGSYLLETLGTQRWGGRLYEVGVAASSSAEAARVMMNSRERCTHCSKSFGLARKDARERIHTYVCEANSHIGDHYSDWSAALCTNCYVQMSAGGFTNYLDFRFSENPPCPRCSFRRSVGYFSQPYVTDVPQIESPWEFYSEPYRHWDNRGYWLCHHCHFVFGESPETGDRFF